MMQGQLSAFIHPLFILEENLLQRFMPTDPAVYIIVHSLVCRSQSNPASARQALHEIKGTSKVGQGARDG